MYVYTSIHVHMYAFIFIVIKMQIFKLIKLKLPISLTKSVCVWVNTHTNTSTNNHKYIHIRVSNKLQLCPAVFFFCFVLLNSIIKAKVSQAKKLKKNRRQKPPFTKGYKNLWIYATPWTTAHNVVICRVAFYKQSKKIKRSKCEFFGLNYLVM